MALLEDVAVRAACFADAVILLDDVAVRRRGVEDFLRINSPELLNPADCLVVLVMMLVLWFDVSDLLCIFLNLLVDE